MEFKLLQPKNLLGIGLLILLVFFVIQAGTKAGTGASSLKTSSAQGQGTHTEEQTDMLSLEEKSVDIQTLWEAELVKRLVFHRKINERCPYYEPDGVGYSKCLVEELTRQETKTENLYNRLLNKAASDESEGSTGRIRATLAEMLPAFKDNYQKATEALCKIREAEYGAGTAAGKMYVQCKIRKAEEYINLLSDWDDFFFNSEYENN